MLRAGVGLVGASGAGRLGRLAGGGDVVSCVGVHTGGLARGWLVSSNCTWYLTGWPVCW